MSKFFEDLQLGVYFHTDTIYLADTLSENHTGLGPEYALSIVEGEYISAIDSSLYSFVEYNVSPDIELNQLIYDEEEWVHVQDTVYADMPYEFMVFSQLSSYLEINWVENFSCSGMGGNVCAFLIDDVSVYLLGTEPEEVDAGQDAVLCLGDSIQIGTAAIEDYMYWWSPNESMPLDTFGYVNPGIVWVSPIESTQYTLTQKDFAFAESSDVVNIEVSTLLSDCIQPNFAGESVSICLGDTLTIGTSNYPFFTYEWSPQNNLESPYSGITQFIPEQTGIYFYNQLIFDSLGNFMSDVVTVTVDCGQNLSETLASQISVSPNPASSIAKVSSTYFIKSWELYDNQGKLHQKSSDGIVNEITLKLSNLPVGKYYLELDVEGEKVVKQILVSR